MMMPYRYNGGFRIHQAPGMAVLEAEMIHEARVVYTDGRPQPATMDYDIGIEFTRNSDGTVSGRVIDLMPGEIDKPLRHLRVEDRTVAFIFPNVDP